MVREPVEKQERKEMSDQVRMAAVRHGSREYDATLALRDALLRKPLGLKFSEQALRAESGDHHLACYAGERLVACLVLTPQSGGVVRMRQVAVAADFQRKGYGRALVAHAERVATELGFSEMIAHARETAVPFYERLGYVTDGPPFSEVGMPHLLVRKKLR